MEESRSPIDEEYNMEIEDWIYMERANMHCLGIECTRSFAIGSLSLSLHTVFKSLEEKIGPIEKGMLRHSYLACSINI
jgi:hypothetical protein